MKKIYFFLFIYLLIIYWSFLIPGPRVATDFHYSYPEHLRSLFDLPFVWSIRWGGGLGHYVSSLWAWPFELTYGLLGMIGISYSIAERILGPLLIIILGFFGINRLLNYYKIFPVGKLVGTAFFLSNTYLLLLIDGGQMNLAIAYSIVPLAFYLYKQCIDTFRLKKLCLFTLSLLGISIVDLRIVVLLALLIFLNFIFDLFFPKNKTRFEILKRNFLTGSFASLFLIFTNIFWILPILFSKTTSFVSQDYLSLSQADLFSFSKLSNGIFLQQPHWYHNDFGKIFPINPDFLLIPLLVMLAPILSRKSLTVCFWLLSALIFIFLSKGTNPPLEVFSHWVFNNIPIFILFRDPTKFFFLVALSYSVLIAISIDEISKLLSGKKYLKIFLPILILIYFLYLNVPVITLKMTGTFSPAIFVNEFEDLAEEIGKDPGFSRLVWIPVKSSLGYEDPNHPAIDAYTLMEKRPFAISNKGTYERLNFLREATYSGQLLNVAGIDSIIYPPLDYRKDLSQDQKEYYSTFLNQLKEMPYVKSLDPDSKIPKLNLLDHQDRFFIPQNFWWVIGSDNVYKESTKSASLNLSNNALVFPEETAGFGERIINYPFAKILLNDKTALDFTATLFPKTDLIFPSKNLNKDPDNSGWWKRDTSDSLSWKDFLETKYGIINQDFDLTGGWAAAEGNLELKINDPKINSNKILLARVLESTKSGELLFYQNNELIGGVSTLRAGDNVRWFEIGGLKNDSGLTIKSKGEINVINSLAIMNENDLESLKSKSEKILSLQQTQSLDEAFSKIPDIKLTYKKINPTKFEVNISGLDSPKLLIFSDSFSGLWRLNGQEPIPVFSILNGFVVEKDGDYLVEFSPQKYIYPGLVISVISFLILLALLVKTRND